MKTGAGGGGARRLGPPTLRRWTEGAPLACCLAVGVAAGVPAAFSVGHSAPALRGSDLSSVADTLVQVWGASVTATSGGLATVVLRIDMTGSGAGLGRIRGRVRFEPVLLGFEAFAPGDASGELEVDANRAAEGVLPFDLEASGPTGSWGRARLAELTFRVLAPPGGMAAVVLELETLEAAGSGADLLDRTTVREGVVLVR